MQTTSLMLSQGARRRLRAVALAVALTLALTGLVGCATNPVTGNRQFGFSSEAREIRIGESRYLAARQSEGGDFTSSPELSAYVTEVGARVAAESDRPELPYEFTIVNSSALSAWSLPGGKIGITRGLLARLERESELAAVLGHEIAHAAARHAQSAMDRDGVIQLAAGGATAAAFMFGLPIPFIALVAHDDRQTWIIRRRHSDGEEVEADLYGMEYMRRAGYDPSAGLDLTTRLLTEAREEEWRGDGVPLFRSHPPTSRRMSAARLRAYQLEREHGPPAADDRETFALRMGWLREREEAYRVFEAGVQALTLGEFEQALAGARAAISIVPSERIFHELEGDVFMMQGRYEAALGSYLIALRINPNDAGAYLRRGRARKELGDVQGAYDDFRISMALYPTTLARDEMEELLPPVRRYDDFEWNSGIRRHGGFWGY